MAPAEQIQRVAIVTGAGRGIGRAIALTLGDRGAAVVVVARTLAEVEETAALLQSHGQRAMAVTADVTDERAVEELVARVLCEMGGVHILVNNAGRQGPIGPLVENDPADWWRTIQVNLLGAFLCCRAVLPTMIQQGWGRIINIAGSGAANPRPNFSAYAASKAALVRLTETLAEEVVLDNVLVNAVVPGAVDTHMPDEAPATGERAGAAEPAQARQRQLAGCTNMAPAADLVAFLASDDVGFTGRLISAVHDPWQTWAQGKKVAPFFPWLTLRRIDSYTLDSLLD